MSTSLNPPAPAGPEPDETAPLAGRRLVTAGLFWAMAVVAVEATVVSTALPTVIGELRGMDLYPWVFSAYLLSSTVVVPIFGKLADLYGRKPVFLGGMVVFLLGTTLCGLSGSMPFLVGARALQGLGAGAVMPLVFTIVGDLYPLEQRGKIQGLMSLLWGTASLFGPALGAFLTLNFSWRWVFLINVPFAIVSGVLIGVYLRERVQRRSVSIDYAGAVVLAAALLVLMLAMLEGGRSLAWASPEMVGLVGLSLALLAGFVQIERRAADPLLPMSLFKLSVVSVASVGNVLQGAQLFALTAYIPLYVQGVRGESAAGAGAALTPMLVGWTMSGTFGPKVLLRFGFRTAALLGTGSLLLGSLPLMGLDRDTPAWLLGISMLLLGTGFGWSNTAFVVAVQAAVAWEVRGVATSSTQLFRSLGGTVGVALLGALLASGLQGNLAGGAAESASLLEAGARSSLSPAALEALQTALADALRPVFVLLALLAAAGVAVVLRCARQGVGGQESRVGDSVRSGH